MGWSNNLRVRWLDQTQSTRARQGTFVGDCSKLWSNIELIKSAGTNELFAAPL